MDLCRDRGLLSGSIGPCGGGLGIGRSASSATEAVLPPLEEELRCSSLVSSLAPGDDTWDSIMIWNSIDLLTRTCHQSIC